jgi:O-methyltransferase
MKKVVIWGTGQGGIMMRNLLRADMEVVAYCDNNIKLHGTMVDDIPVINPQQLLQIKLDCIFIAILNKEACIQVKSQIEMMEINCKIIVISEYREQFDIRLATVKLIAKEIIERNVDGAVAELGVYQGELAAEINRLFPDRKIYLFDTFEGFDERDIKIEKENQFSYAQIGKFNNTNINMVYKRLPHKEQAIFKKGYFPETTSGLNLRFALVSLDADLYQPIYEGLKFFYPLMNSGGYIIIHDYNNNQFKGVKMAVKQFCSENDIFIVPLCDIHGTAVIIKQ